MKIYTGGYFHQLKRDQKYFSEPKRKINKEYEQTFQEEETQGAKRQIKKFSDSLAMIEVQI